MTVMRLAFVKEYTDRTGKLRRYFRKRGRKPVALPGGLAGIHEGVPDGYGQPTGAAGGSERWRGHSGRSHNRLSAQPIFRFEP
jgi:hypothetical protein